MSVRACVRAYALRIVSRDKILRFKNTFIIIIIIIIIISRSRDRKEKDTAMRDKH